jgi:hypothetical protein
MATSGRITSHFLTWYSTHSLLIVMSPSKKCMRGLGLILQQIGDAVGAHVHAIDFPVGGLEDALGQVVADEAVDAEDEDFFHDKLGFTCRELRGFSSAGGKCAGRRPARLWMISARPSPQTPRMHYPPPPGRAANRRSGQSTTPR